MKKCKRGGGHQEYSDYWSQNNKWKQHFGWFKTKKEIRNHNYSMNDEKNSPNDCKCNSIQTKLCGSFIISQILEKFKIISLIVTPAKQAFLKNLSYSY